MASVFDFDFQSLKGKRILIADDLKDTQILSSLFLVKFGAEVEVASSGEEVIQKALHGHFDAILMDVHMPELDGLKATERLRKAGYQKPILIMTADGRSGIKEKAFALGANICLSKPLTWIEMLHAIERFCVDAASSKMKFCIH